MIQHLEFGRHVLIWSFCDFFFFLGFLLQQILVFYDL